MRSIFYKIFSWMIILALVFSTSLPAFAQISGPKTVSQSALQNSEPHSALSTSTITGKIVDSSGNPIGGVVVTAFPVPSEVKITSVSSDYDLAGSYPLGMGPINVTLTVKVDWGTKTPGTVRFQFNTAAPISVGAVGDTAIKTLRLDQQLRAGNNTLKITAVSTDGTSSGPRTYQPKGYTSQFGWLPTILGSPPIMQTDKIEFKVLVPQNPVQMPGLNIWFPGKATKMSPQAVGKITLPLRGGLYSIGIGAHYEPVVPGPTGNRSWMGRNALTLLNKTDLQTDFMGQLEGNMKPVFPYLDRPSLIRFTAVGKAAITMTVPAVLAIEPLAPVGPSIVAGIRAVPPLYTFLQDTAQFYLQLGPEVGGDLALNWAQPNMAPVTANLYAQVDLEAGLKMNLLIASGKVYVAGGSRLDFRFIPQPAITKWAFYGRGGYAVTTAWFTASHEDKIEWIAYQAPPIQASNLLQDINSGQLTWTLIPRSYATPTYSSFAAQDIRSQPFALTSVTQPTDSAILVSNVYPRTEPALALTGDGQALMLWNYDNPAKPLGQGYDLQFSRWDGISWSSPAALTNDTYPDTKAQVAWLANGNAVAVWERLDDPALSVNATLDITQTRKFDLAWSLYTAASNTWSAPQWLTHTPGAADLTPVLSHAADGSLWVAWNNNSQGVLFGSAQNPDRILAAHWNGSGWDAAQTAAAAIPGTTDLTMAHSGSQAAIAWTTQITPTGSLTPTMQVFSTQFNGSVWSSPVQLTNDSLQNTQPRLVYRQGAPYLAWMAGRNLTLQSLAALQNSPNPAIMAPLAAAAQVPVPDGLQIDQFNLQKDAQDNLLAVFTAQHGQQRDLYLAYYDAALNLWGRPQPLSNDAGSESYPAAAVDSQQNLLMGFSQTEQLSQVLTATVPGTTQVVSYTMPVDGATNLMTLSHTLARDLAAESLAVSSDYPQPGSQVILTGTLLNRGDLPIQNIPYVFQDNGTPFYTQTIPGPLAAGQVITVTTPYTVPAVGDAHLLSLAFDPANSIAEVNETNNYREIHVFGPDLAVQRVFLDQTGNYVNVTAVVQNLGPAQSPASLVNLYSPAVTGTLYLTKTLPALSAGQVVTLTLSGYLGNLPMGDQTMLVAANPKQAGFAELVTRNNSSSFKMHSGPDLGIESQRVYHTPLDNPGVNLQIGVENFGMTRSVTTTLAIFTRSSLDVSSLALETNVPPLQSGQLISLTVPVSGTFACGLYLQLDPESKVDESSRSNNLVYLPPPGNTCLEGQQLTFLPVILRSGPVGSQAPQVAPVDYMATSQADGTYTIYLPPGKYQVIPSTITYIFEPPARQVNLPVDASTVSSGNDFTIVTKGMVYIPAGEFLMGCSPDHNEQWVCDPSQSPLHRVYLTTYYIGKFEVTNAEYALCVNAGVCSPPSAVSSFSRPEYYGNPVYNNYPVINVSLNLASTYCRWIGMNLPTEAQWEKAARGTTPRTYPWGDGKPGCSMANFSYYDGAYGYSDFHFCESVRDTGPVGNHPAGASPYGVQDMTGNVSEWVSDRYDPNYYAVSPYVNPTGGWGYNSIIRGGSWAGIAVPWNHSGMRTSSRGSLSPNYNWFEDIGFRCVKMPPR